MPVWLKLPKSEKQIVTYGIGGMSAFFHFIKYVNYNDGLLKPHSTYSADS